MKFLLALLLVIVLWPFGLVLLLLLPIVWVLLLPFRIAGFTLEGILRLVKEVLFLPARLVGGIGRR